MLLDSCYWWIVFNENFCMIMTREELEKMDKSTIIDIVLKQESEMRTREILEKYTREDRDKMQKIIDAISLILNNVKK